MVVPQRILDAIRSSYEDLADPNWAFVERRRAERPYTDVEAALKRFGRVEDDADPEHDIALAVRVYRADAEWEVLLSFVGRFAVVWRHRDPEDYCALDPQQVDDPEDGELVALLQRHELELISPALLYERVPLAIQWAGRSDVPLFAALFTFIDIPE